MRRLTARAVCFTLVALAAGCGSSASAFEVVTKAPDATISESTAKVAMTVDVAGGTTRQFTMKADGAIDFVRKATAMTLDMSDTLGTIGVSPGDATIEMRGQGTAVYMRSPLFARTGGIEAGKWLKLDFNELSKAQGLDLSQLTQAGSNDPRQGLAFLEGATEGGVDDLGNQDVRGVDTTHYRAEVDLEKALSRSGSIIDPGAFRQFIATLGTRTVEIDVWIDGDNRVRRIRLPLPLPKVGTATGSGQITMTMEYFDFGTPVDVAVPPDRDVVDFRQVLGGG